jgi:hypothetical protein
MCAIKFNINILFFSLKAEISSRISNQDHKMKSLEEKILTPQSIEHTGNGPPVSIT